MFARLFTHFFLSLISFISLIATQSFADDLFTDWTTSDLNDVTIPDSNSQLFPGDINTDQLLAFNNEPSSNMFTSDFFASDFSTVNPSTSDPLNQVATDPPLDMSNMFLDSTPLTSLDTTAFDPSVSNELALPDLPSDLFGSDATSPDLLAGNPSGGCSSFRPSSSSKKSRKRESAGQACKDNSYGAQEEIDSAMQGFFDKSAAAQAEAYKKIVCPSAHYGKAVQIPVCSSPDPTKTARMGLLSPVFPDSETLADSTLSKSSLVLFCLNMGKINQP